MKKLIKLSSLDLYGLRDKALKRKNFIAAIRKNIISPQSKKRI